MATEKLNTLTLRTPEGVFFSFQLASPITRFMAFALDFTIIFIFTSVTGQFIALLSFISMDIVFALQILYFFIVSVGYGITLEWLLKGQTLGKKILRLRVMDVKGLKLQFNQVVVRNLLRFVDSLPVFYLIGGLGSTDFADDSNFTVNFGFGFKIFPTDVFAIRIEARDYLFDTEINAEDKTLNNMQGTLNFSWFF